MAVLIGSFLEGVALRTCGVGWLGETAGRCASRRIHATGVERCDGCYDEHRVDPTAQRRNLACAALDVCGGCWRRARWLDRHQHEVGLEPGVRPSDRRHIETVLLPATGCRGVHPEWAMTAYGSLRNVGA